MRFIKPHDVVLADVPRSPCMAKGEEEKGDALQSRSKEFQRKIVLES